MSGEALTLRARAPAKVNLGLFLGPVRADGRHELVTVMQSISLADELELGPAGDEAQADEVLCPGVDEPNLAARALAAFRAATGWDAPPLRLEIDKQIPVAAGLAGGSADAAATLRLAAAASGLGDEALLLELAAELGADVPAQVSPGRYLATGAGERLEPLPAPNPPFGVLLLPSTRTLATADVYAEADRLGLARTGEELSRRRRALHDALDFGVSVPPPELLVNDLQPAARSLCPTIDDALGEAREAGADAMLVSGSGPAVFGLFLRANVAGRLERARASVGARVPPAIVAAPVAAGFGAPVQVAGRPD